MLGRRLRLVAWFGAGSLAVTGCLNPRMRIPAGNLPPPTTATDAATATILDLPREKAPNPPPAKDGKGFDLPTGLPGTEVPPFATPKLEKGATPADRLKAVQAAYPELRPASAAIPAGEGTLSLADLQKLAMENSPVVVQARADAGVAYGHAIQAGLAPNPTTGYQVDQWVPPQGPGSNSGQQGWFYNQLLKFPGKLSLARAVSGFDYLNAEVAVRRAEVDVRTAVRTQYFKLLVARQTLEVTKSLVDLADEVYQLQLRQVASGLAAGYEPLQIHAQAVQARNTLAQAEATYRASWGQLAAAVGRRDLPLAAIAGRADLPAPLIDPAAVLARTLDVHTDVLTARNRILQAEVNLRLQRLTPVPDLSTDVYVEYDNLAKKNQFGLQLGLPMPVWNRNQGNIRAAEANIASATAALEVTRNDLSGRVAEAVGRYEANRIIAANYRDKILPSLTQAYRGIVRRYQAEPDKVSFNDIVVAQFNLGQALHAYLAALSAQWQSIVDLANLAQVEELYTAPPEPVPPRPEEKQP